MLAHQAARRLPERESPGGFALQWTLARSTTRPFAEGRGLLKRCHILAFAVALAAALFVVPATASASPLSQAQAQAAAAKARIEALDTKLAADVAAYETAQSKVARIRRQVDRNSAQLDELVTRLDRVQGRLDARAIDMYRTGPYAFVEVLAGTTSFEQFVGTWDLLTEMSRQDADMIQAVRKARSAAVASASALSQRQAAASAELRAADTARASASKELASRKQLLSTYQGRVADLKASAAAKAEVIAKSSSSSGSSGGGSSGSSSGGSSSGGSGTNQGATGSGGWASALCTWYGPGFYGNHTADGTLLTPDSMVVASNSLSFGTLIEFRFHGNRAVARVADTGAFGSGVVFDLGPGTARTLGFDGEEQVEYRIIGR